MENGMDVPRKKEVNGGTVFIPRFVVGFVGPW
jgi:hypothetical protein